MRYQPLISAAYFKPRDGRPTQAHFVRPIICLSVIQK
jgi:hypothetical protein